MGIADNTLFIYILGDNGAGPEGAANGLLNENTYLNGVEETLDEVAQQLDKLETRESFSHFAAWLRKTRLVRFAGFVSKTRPSPPGPGPDIHCDGGERPLPAR